MIITGSSASTITASAESAIRAGVLASGERLPTTRGLAARLGVSPATVAAAYQALRRRGLIRAAGRTGTVVSATPEVIIRPAPPVPSGVRNLADGRPDPDLLPDLARSLAHVSAARCNYGAPYNREDLLELAARSFRADDLPSGPIAVVAGALDAIERIIGANLRIGDRVIVEDPGYPPILDLLTAMGLRIEPCALDDAGLLPDALDRALKMGVSALLLTPRAQNPTGATLERGRAAELRQILRRWPSVTVIEDDHAGAIAGAPALTLCEAGRGPWVVVRSMSKTFGPDLRMALITGDPLTIARVEGRQRLGYGWVSHILQELMVKVWREPTAARLVKKAATAYTLRRESLLAALASHGIAAQGKSGLNVWVPVPEELTVMQAMLDAGWALSAGSRYRLKSRPAVRISIATLPPEGAHRLAADLARSLAPSRRAHHA